MERHTDSHTTFLLEQNVKLRLYCTDGRFSANSCHPTMGNICTMAQEVAQIYLQSSTVLLLKIIQKFPCLKAFNYIQT